MESKNPIPAPAKGLAKILASGAAGIQAELIGAAPIHNMFGNGQMSMLANEQTVEDLEKKITGQSTVVATTFQRGDDVVDIEKKRKGTIIRGLKAQSDDGQKRFEIVDSKGNAWKQKTSLLRLQK